jgi:3-methyladenine DNA glycosylase/8-oxoguanine DNA glycosylase
MEFVIPAPARFNFRRTVLSHGWSVLPPFELDRGTLRRVISTPGRRPVVAAFHEVPRGVRIEVEPLRMSARGVAEVARQTSKIFGLGVDLEPFYRTASRHEDLRWVGRAGAGRLLRSPTVFEDLVKLILTTNCAWASTLRMVKALVDLGEEASGGRRGFPVPSAVATAGERYLRDRARAGYRAESIARLAEAVAGGDVDLEAWEHLPAAEVRRRALALRGVGEYVADNLLRLLGRSRGLALDSWVRSVLAERAGRQLTDSEIARRYEHFGEHAGLALWCDVTRDWPDRPDARLPTLARV